LRAAADPVLTFSVTSKNVPDTRSTAKPAPKTTVEEFPLTVTLGRQYLVLEHHGHRTVYDFEHRRLYEIDVGAQTYRDSSLFTDIGFRVAEFQNRLTLGAQLAAGGLKNNPMQPALIEHLLSLSADSEHTVVDDVAHRDERVFSWKGRELLAVSTASSPLPADYQAAYWRFLRYYAAGHPAIYARLADTPGVPRMLRIVRTNINEETRTLRLTGLEMRADTEYSLAGLTLETPPHGDPYGQIAALARDGATMIPGRIAQALSDRDAALGEGRYLDSMLRHFEASIEDGSLAQDWMAAHREQLSADPESGRFAGALRPSRGDEAEAAVKALEELKRAEPAQRYLLDVFEGNTLSRLGRRGEAVTHLLSALNSNPYLVGAWFDIGGAYYASFQPVEAWACWDAARAARPAHPFRSVPDRLEQRLLHDHPEFF